jgi:DNA-binding NtrC family response regulator
LWRGRPLGAAIEYSPSNPAIHKVDAVSNPPRTVLVVDDDDTLLRLVARVIARGGDRVLTASSGEAARTLFEEHADSVDIVVLDVSLPGGEGAQSLMPDMLAARPTLKVIVTSGALLPSPLALEVERIGGEFLRKPFVPNTLLRMLDGGEEAGLDEARPSGPGVA